MLVYKSKFLTLDAELYTYPHIHQWSNEEDRVWGREIKQRYSIHIAYTVQMNWDLKRFEYEEMFEPPQVVSDCDNMPDHDWTFGSETTMKLYEFLKACDYLWVEETNESNLPYLIHKSCIEQMKETENN